jgi:prepilin-type N-terminal cleavage/methylation domain-containing protein
MKGFSLIELLVVMAVVTVILAVAIPSTIKFRLNAAETIVIREVQTIAQAQTQYLSQFGRYATTLAELGPAHGVADSPAAAGLIPAKLASGEKDGYLFTLTSTPGGYVVNATPKTFGSTGRRTFYLDQNGVVHENWGSQPATDASPEAKLNSNRVMHAGLALQLAPTNQTAAQRVHERFGKHKIHQLPVVHALHKQ